MEFVRARNADRNRLGIFRYDDANPLPLVVATSFVSAVFVWRTLPSDIPHFGASAGVLATLGTYLLAVLVLFVLNVAVVATYGQYAQIPEAASFMALVGFVALTSTFWLTLPVGAVSGFVHERVTPEGTEQT